MKGSSRGSTRDLQRHLRGSAEWKRLRSGVCPCLPGESEGPVDAPLQPLPALRLPHEPQLQAVHTAAALHHLVSGVQSHIVELVLLEEVAGLGPVAPLEKVLWRGSCQSGLPTGCTEDSAHPFLSPELGSTEGSCQSTQTSLRVAPNITALP